MLKAKTAAPDIAKQTFGEYMLAWLESIRTGDEEDFVCVNDKNQKHYTRHQVERTMKRIVRNQDRIGAAGI